MERWHVQDIGGRWPTLKRLFGYIEPAVETVFQAVEWALVISAVAYLGNKVRSDWILAVAAVLAVLQMLYLGIKISEIGLLFDPERKGRGGWWNVFFVVVAGSVLTALYQQIFALIVRAG